eukprot:Em0016g426a
MSELAEAVKRAREIAAKMLPATAGTQADSNPRKRQLDEGFEETTPPTQKKPTVDGTALSTADPQSIAQAAIAKVGAQLGLQQMITIDIKVPNRMVGLIIGRGGEMINRLQAESGARLQVAPDGSEINGERQVTIYGNTDAVDKAKGLVNKVVEDAGGQTTLMSEEVVVSALVEVELVVVEWVVVVVVGGMGGGGMGGGDGGGQECIELLIPANKVGLVIGKGGEMIKALQERAGCKMQMIQDGQYASAPEKPLRMTGSRMACQRARDLVMELIEQKEMEARGLGGGFQNGVPQTIEVQVPKGLVGFVIGRNGEHINNIQNTCGVRLQFQNDIPGTEYRAATISGPPDACQRAKKMVEDIVAERQQMGYKPRLELPNPNGPGVQNVQMSVPGNKCGLVIGKGGETIRQLQVQSGAHIELFRGTQPNPNEKLFNLRGTAQQVAVAQQLIRQKCDLGPGGFSGSPTPGMPYQAMFGGPQQSYGQGSPGPAANPWAQYPYQQAYGAAAAAQQQQGVDPTIPTIRRSIVKTVPTRLHGLLITSNTSSCMQPRLHRHRQPRPKRRGSSSQHRDSQDNQLHMVLDSPPRQLLRTTKHSGRSTIVSLVMLTMDSSSLVLVNRLVLQELVGNNSDLINSAGHILFAV